jgi:hypothetical protein
MIGGLVLGGARAFAPWLAMAGVPAPFLAMAALALLAAPFVSHVLPNVPHRCNSGAAIDPPNGRRAIRMRLLAIALVSRWWRTIVGASSS